MKKSVNRETLSVTARVLLGPENGKSCLAMLEPLFAAIDADTTVDPDECRRKCVAQAFVRKLVLVLQSQLLWNRRDEDASRGGRLYAAIIEALPSRPMAELDKATSQSVVGILLGTDAAEESGFFDRLAAEAESVMSMEDFSWALTSSLLTLGMSIVVIAYVQEDIGTQATIHAEFIPAMAASYGFARELVRRHEAGAME